MTYSRMSLNQLRRAADEAVLEFVPHTPPWFDVVAWMWATRYMLDGDKVVRELADSYCADYLRDLKAGQVRFR